MSGFDDTQKAALRRLLLGNSKLADTAVPLLPSADGDKDPLIELARYLNAILDVQIVARVPPSTLEALGFEALSSGSLAQFCIGLRAQQPQAFSDEALQEMPMPRTPTAKREFLRALVDDPDLFMSLPLHRRAGKTQPAEYGPLAPTGWVVHHDVSADHLPRELMDGKGEVHQVYHGDSDWVVYNKQRDLTDELDYAVLLKDLITKAQIQGQHTRVSPAIALVKVLQNIGHDSQRRKVSDTLLKEPWIPSGQHLLTPPILYFGEVHKHLANKCNDVVHPLPDDEFIKADTTNLFVVPVTEKIANYVDAYWSSMGLKELVALRTGDQFNTWLKLLPAAGDIKAGFAALEPLLRLRDWCDAFKSWLDVKPEDRPAMDARDAIVNELYQRPMPKRLVNDCFECAATQLQADPMHHHDPFRTVVESLWTRYMNDQGIIAGQWAAALYQNHGFEHAREVLHRVLNVVSSKPGDDHFRVFPAHERPDETLSGLPTYALILTRPTKDEWKAWRKLSAQQIECTVVFESVHKAVRVRQRQLNPKGDPTVGRLLVQFLISARLGQPYLCNRVLEVIEVCDLTDYPTGEWVACNAGSAESPRYESICHRGLYDLEACHGKVYRKFPKEVQPPLERPALDQLYNLNLVERGVDAWSRVLESLSPNGYGRLVEPQGPLLPAPGIDGPFGNDKKVEALLNLLACTDDDEDGYASTGHGSQALKEVHDALAERLLPNKLVIDVFESLTERFFDEAHDPGCSEGTPAISDDNGSLLDTDWWPLLLARYCKLAAAGSQSLRDALTWLTRWVAPQGNRASVDLSPRVDAVASKILGRLLQDGKAWHHQDLAMLQNAMIRTNRDRHWRRAELLVVTQDVGDEDRVAHDLAPVLAFTGPGPGPDDTCEEVAWYVEGTGLSHDTQFRTKLGLLAFALGAHEIAESMVDEYTLGILGPLTSPSAKQVIVAPASKRRVNLIGEPLGDDNEGMDSLLIHADPHTVRLHRPERLRQSRDISRVILCTIQRVCGECGLIQLSADLGKAFEDVDGSSLWSLALYKSSLRNLNEWLDTGVPEIDKMLAQFEGRELHQYAHAAVAGSVTPIPPDEFEREVMTLALEGHADTLENIAKHRIESRGYSANSVLFELLQNADDALLEARALGYDDVRPEIEVSLGSDQFRLVHYGRPIGEVRPKPQTIVNVDEARTRRWRWDLRAMLRWGTTTKLTQREDGKQDVVETGFYGLGFKSIFTIAKAPVIRSGLLSFRVLGAKVPVPLVDEPSASPHLAPRAGAGLTEKGPYGRTEIVLPLRDDAREASKAGVKAPAEAAADHFRWLLPYSLLFTQVVTGATLLRDNAQDEYRWTRTNPEDLGVRGLVFQEAKTRRKVVLVGEFPPTIAGRCQSPCDLAFSRIAIAVDDELNVLPPNHDLPADRDLPRVWVLAPTKADAGHLPFLVNARFTVNEGRGDLRQGAEQWAAVKSLENALIQLVERLERSPAEECERFVRSLWDAFGTVSLPEHGTARSFLDLVLWGPVGLLRWIAASFGAPLQGAKPQAVLVPVRSERPLLVLHEPLITFFINAEEEFWDAYSNADRRSTVVAFDLPRSASSPWCPRYILNKLNLSDAQLVEVTLDTAPEGVKNAITGVGSQSSPVVATAVLLHRINATLADTRTGATDVNSAFKAIREAVGSVPGLLTDSGPAGGPAGDRPSSANGPSGKLADDDAKAAIEEMCRLARRHDITLKWHEAWHDRARDQLLSDLSAGLTTTGGSFDRKAWMRMFCLGTTQLLQAQQQPVQHRGFIEHLVAAGWWDELFATPPDAARWFRVLKAWSDRREESTSPYDWWMGALPELFVAASGVEDYAAQLSYLGRRPDPPALLVARVDPVLQGTVHKSPAVPRLRASWVVRELARFGFYEKLGVHAGDVHKIHMWCFAPRRRLVTALHVLGCEVTDPRASKAWRKESTGIDSRQLWNGWVQRCKELDVSDHTLLNTFDLPLISAEFAEYLKSKHRISLTASE